MCARVSGILLRANEVTEASSARHRGCCRACRAQKQGTRTLPRLVYDVKVVKEYLKHPTWGTGLALGARARARTHARIALRRPRLPYPLPP
jgi:hypothetical protein